MPDEQPSVETAAIETFQYAPSASGNEQLVDSGTTNGTNWRRLEPTTASAAATTYPVDMIDQEE